MPIPTWHSFLSTMFRLSCVLPCVLHVCLITFVCCGNNRAHLAHNVLPTPWKIPENPSTIPNPRLPLIAHVRLGSVVFTPRNSIPCRLQFIRICFLLQIFDYPPGTLLFFHLLCLTVSHFHCPLKISLKFSQFENNTTCNQYSTVQFIGKNYWIFYSLYNGAISANYEIFHMLIFLTVSPPPTLLPPFFSCCSKKEKRESLKRCHIRKCFSLVVSLL
jgi:hypothetical protein